jgi:hypothetical protein
MIPAAPRELRHAVEIVEHLVGGLVGTCCMCRSSCVQWLDLIEAELQPVTDAYGALTDHACLHGRCAGALIEHWASMTNHGGPGELTDPDDQRAHDDDEVPDRCDEGDDVLAGPAVPTTLIAPIGIYAQGRS